MKYEDAVKKLSEYGQEHVLRFYETLDEGEKEALLRQIDETDFSVISALGNEKENIKRGVITQEGNLQGRRTCRYPRRQGRRCSARRRYGNQTGKPGPQGDV